MTAFTPYLTCSGNTREVLDHYQSLFGGQVHVMTYAQMPDVDSMPVPPPADAVAHGTLTGGLVSIAAGDDIFSEEKVSLESNAYAFLLEPETVAEAQKLIEAIVQGGGEIAMPFEAAPWGDHYGQAKDRFGVLWHFNVSGGQQG